MLPLREHRDEIVLRTRALSILADDGSGTSWDPIKVEGEAATEPTLTPRRATRGRADDEAASEVDGRAEGASRRARAVGVGRQRAERRGTARATRTLCASWWVGGSTTTDAWSAKPPRSARVRRPFPLRINPHDAAALGRRSRAREVRVTSNRGSITVTVDRADAGVPTGVAQLDFSADGLGAAELIDADARDHRPARGDASMSQLVARGRPALQRPTMSWSVLGVVLIKVVIAFVILLVSVMLYIWGMRKVIADMQNRIGPNRAGPYGVLQTLADGIKLFFKEQSIPTTADRPVFRLAPYLSIMPAFLMFCIVPIGGTVSILGHRTYLQVADLPVGALFILAMSGLGVYGVMLAGWSSGSKYPLLGAVRSTAQLLSYEAAFGLAILGVLIQAGTLSTHAIVAQQAWVGPALVRCATGSGCARSCRSASS